MTSKKTGVIAGTGHIQPHAGAITGKYVLLEGESYYCIQNYDQMPPFFMSLVSASDHWLFISSTGGLTAGRTNAESALFPYTTDDKITAGSGHTGPKTMMLVTRGGNTWLWEPFSARYDYLYRRERNLYKNIPGSKLIFEEVNHDLGLTFRYGWSTSEQFGFVRSCWLQNDGDEDCDVQLLDGLLNVLPYGATTTLQTTLSNLLNAYKRNELDVDTGLGMFSLSATLTDRAEPSESLQATVVWQLGLDPAAYLLSATQLDRFRRGEGVKAEVDVCGQAGAYLVQANVSLAAGEKRPWHMVADVNQDSRAVVALRRQLRLNRDTLPAMLAADVAFGNDALIKFVAAADGMQQTAEPTTTSRHFANVLFNIMRGGIFANGYQIDKVDFVAFVETRNKVILAAKAEWFAVLPATIAVGELYDRAVASGSADLVRLCYEYLPLMFSRRHGDPSRPWNRFSINLKYADGSPRLDYQGNWRDIFQNWEPLAYAFPQYAMSMIACFLNATTADGYNPYRMTRDGIEWEEPEPDNPWANIGYWSDHQIIYLQKLFEIAEQVEPGALQVQWSRPIFAYANVPYRLRPYDRMLQDWANTVDFDDDAAEETAAAVKRMGTDGRLLHDPDGVVHVTMIEKLLVLLLAKVTNLVPGGGIWMNTQRPEWNDANNALVGKGLSVVTVAYLHRFVAFWLAQLDAAEADNFEVNTAVADLLQQVHAILSGRRQMLQGEVTDSDRREIMDALGMAITAYRHTVYLMGVPAMKTAVSRDDLRDFLSTVQAYCVHTLRANRRDDGLYHAYNTLILGDSTAEVDHLYTMLEGQVAVLSAGVLSAAEVVTLLKQMPQSDLYRRDQHTYMLYPNRELPGFLQKNSVPGDRARESALVRALAANGDSRLLAADVEGDFHFNGRFRNAEDVAAVLQKLIHEPAYAELAAHDYDLILDLFEKTFDHRNFTGRSGTFYAFEGLGSVYWHMVSKLLLAVQECYLDAVRAGEDTAVTQALFAAYYDIRSGLGFNKSPDIYGAFPTDPYSHTPLGSGARQPGMTGQVKEEILTRWGELGVTIEQGVVAFMPTLLRRDEFLKQADTFRYVDVAGNWHTISLPKDALAFTFCQVPIVYLNNGSNQIEVVEENGRTHTLSGPHLTADISRHMFQRSGHIRQITVGVSV